MKKGSNFGLEKDHFEPSWIHGKETYTPHLGLVRKKIFLGFWNHDQRKLGLMMKTFKGLSFEGFHHESCLFSHVDF